MKKILLGLMILMLTISLSAQKTQYYDLIIQKTTPLLHLYGSGGIINWNNGDILWTHTSNTITMSGGNFLTSGTSYIGVGATAPLHQVVVASSLTNGLNALNIVNSTTNKNRTTTTQARDTSSLNLWYTYTGSPLLTMTDKNGNILFRADSVGIGIGTGVAQHKLVVLTDPLTKLNAFNFVNTVNKRRDTPQQAADTSSLNMSFSTTGSPMLSLTSKTGTNLLYIDSSKVSTTLDFAYGMKHAIGSADSIAYSTGTTQNWDYKINTTAFTWRENDGFTAAGDSIRILTTGDYEVHIWVAATTSNANDKMRVRLYVNNLRLASTSFGRMLINSNGSGNAETHYFIWYKEFTANDYISWRIANETGARASVVSDIKVYVKKVPEN